MDRLAELLASAEAELGRIKAAVQARNPDCTFPEGSDALVEELMTGDERSRSRAIKITMEELRRHR